MAFNGFFATKKVVEPCCTSVLERSLTRYSTTQKAQKGFENTNNHRISMLGLELKGHLQHPHCGRVQGSIASSLK